MFAKTKSSRNTLSFLQHPIFAFGWTVCDMWPLPTTGWLHLSHVFYREILFWNFILGTKLDLKLSVSWKTFSNKKCSTNHRVLVEPLSDYERVKSVTEAVVEGSFVAYVFSKRSSIPISPVRNKFKRLRSIAFLQNCQHHWKRPFSKNDNLRCSFLAL